MTKTMKIIIPIIFYRKGGVERVIISLVSNLIKDVEQIILIVYDKDMEYFKTILPNSDKLVYELWTWPLSSPQRKIVSLLNKSLSIARKLKLEALITFIKKRLQTLQIQSRINYLIKKDRATQCLYILINRLEPPNITIPLSAISYDLFWRFAPLSYSDDYIANYDKYLLLWLQKADLIFTISEKTRNDIISVFPSPEFAPKLQAVPLAGFPSNETKATFEVENKQTIVFYFPSSFGIYKDHLTLLKAGLELAQNKIDFKIVFIGKETDNLVNGTLTLSQQKQTQEYDEYIRQCNEIYENNKAPIEQHVQGLGYCDYEKVEYYYQTCSCVVVPSQYEGFGLAISEAIVRGLPVIATNLDVFKEQAELYQCSDRITFFSKGNVKELAACLEQFIQNPITRLSPSEIEARFYHWTWEDVAREYLTQLGKIPLKSKS